MFQTFSQINETLELQAALVGTSHSGPCGRPDTVNTFGISKDQANWRRKKIENFYFEMEITNFLLNLGQECQWVICDL